MPELFNKPRITATNADDKIQQLTTYIYQLVEQLNWAFNALPGGTDDQAAAGKTTGGR